MALGDTKNGNVPSLTKDNQLPSAVVTAPHNNDQTEKGSTEKVASKTNKQIDATISFLRAGRSGEIGKVIEFLESGQVTDINTCNANGLNALHLAAKDGYIDIVSELLRRGANVDNATKKGNTALHIASLAGQKEVIKLLIQYNANVNVQSLNGFTPLYMAAQENHDACVRYLLAKGANPSLATEDGFTPLAVAMQQGHDKVVAVLLESDSRGKVRLPALHIAAKKDDVKAATLLLENEHNPDIVSKSGFTPLHIAAHYGNVDIAKLLIERGADVNYIAKHNITPLHVACKWGKTNILQLLLSKNARIDATTRDGLTPLHCAARSGHKEVIELLLENDAPILSKTKNGLAPLHMAAQGEHDEAARILLIHKAPVDEVTVDYLTALHVSAHCGHVKVAKLLLDHNADPNARALNGFTPLHIACKKNRIKVVELLLKHNASISATTESGLTPLHVASFMGCMNIVIYLLQHDANPDAPTVRGETPLHLAARANQTDIIRILLRNGAQVDAKAREGQTPLHVASRLGNTDIIMLMLQHGANVDSTTKDAYTPLHIAAKEGQEEVAALLIENNASLDAVTKKNFSPLHLAAKYGKVQVAQLLLQKGANVDCQGKNGVTPIHVASHYDHQNIALLLLEKGASPHTSAKNGHTALHIAAKKNQMEIATNLLQFGADPNAKSKSGFAPLHLASQEGHVDMVNLLLEHGADPNVSAKNGLTPMHLCAQEDKAEVARILLDHNAHISERTKGGYSPLHVAAHFGQITMVKFLLENDANIELSTNIGYTPLHQAAQQGHTLVINLLLTHKANPNALTNHGQTALSIANKLGYVTAVETLKVVTEKSVTNTVTGVLEEKYKVVAPESMHEAFMSDSEDEGGEDHLDQHQYKYMATDDLKTMINESDQNNYDTTDDDQLDGSNRKTVTETMSTKYVNQNMSPTNAYQIKSIDNVTIIRPPVHLGFLVSFLVDARGGAMRGCRHSGVRVIVPPKSCAQPTRITCRYVKPQRVPNPPPLMEGEALVSRVMELSPVEAKFLGPVILEVPHFGSLRDKEREIIILRSDNGETWREHTLYDSEEAVRDVLNETFESNELSHLEDLHTSRIVRIITRNFPHFFAVVSRIRQEVHAIGPDGGTVSSTAVPQVQAIFPPNALTKKIRVGLQAQPVDLNGCCKLLGQGVAVSPVVTVEPRRRKFHKAITLSIPAPKAYTQGMVNQYSGNAPTLRLLCSITGGQNRAVWEDVTGSTPLAFVKDSVSFTTTVSARFWLMDCRNVSDASRMATELYSYMAQVPFMVKFVVFAKRISNSEAKLSVFCMTDDKEDKTLEHQEYFTEVAKSRDVEILEDQDIYLEFAGNLVPVMKSGEQLNMKFHAFRENRLSFLVRVKDQEEPFGRMSFMSEPKIGKGEPPQTPICTLNVTLTGREIIEDNRTGSQKSLDHSLNYRDMLNFGYRQAEEIHKADIRLSDICNLLEDDWEPLAKELQVPENDIELIKSEYAGKPASQQAMVMIRLWLRQAGANANGNTLEQALHKINRSDIVEKCIFNLELVTDYMEKAVAKMQLDQSGFETLKDELGPSSADSSFVQQERKTTNFLETGKSYPLPASTESLQMEDKQGDAVRKSSENFDEDTELNGQHESAKEDYNIDFVTNDMKTSSPERKGVVEGLSSVKCSTPPPTPIETNNVQNFETIVIRADDADELHQKLITENPETTVIEVPSKVVTTITVQRQQQQQLIEPEEQPQTKIQQLSNDHDFLEDLSPESVIETENLKHTEQLPTEDKQKLLESNRSQLADDSFALVVTPETPQKVQIYSTNLDNSSKLISLDSVEDNDVKRETPLKVQIQPTIVDISSKVASLDNVEKSGVIPETPQKVKIQPTNSKFASLDNVEKGDVIPETPQKVQIQPKNLDNSSKVASLDNIEKGDVIPETPQKVQIQPTNSKVASLDNIEKGDVIPETPQKVQIQPTNSKVASLDSGEKSGVIPETPQKVQIQPTNSKVASLDSGEKSGVIPKTPQKVQIQPTNSKVASLDNIEKGDVIPETPQKVQIQPTNSKVASLDSGEKSGVIPKTPQKVQIQPTNFDISSKIASLDNIKGDDVKPETPQKVQIQPTNFDISSKIASLDNVEDDDVKPETPQKVQIQPKNLDNSSKVASLDNVEEDENFMEISSSNLADVIESDNAPSLSHDAEIVSLTSDVGCSDDIIYDDDQGLMISRIPKSTINTISTSTNIIQSPPQLEQNTKIITKNTRTTRSSDGSECVVVVTETRQMNDVGAEVIVRETVTKRQLKDGTTLPPQVQTTVITMDGSEPNILSSEMSSDMSVNSAVTSPGGTGGFGTTTVNMSANTNNANSFWANTGTGGAGNFAGNDSPFYNPSTKSKTSSTKSLENNFNKTYGSSSDSDIALHEPGVELSEDEEHTEPEFYQGMEQPVVETIVSTITSDDDDGNTIKTTRTITTTKSTVIRDNIDDIQSQKELLEQFLENSILDVAKAAATEASNINDLKDQQQQQLQQNFTAPFGSGYTVQIQETPIISTITTTTTQVTTNETKPEPQLESDDKHHDDNNDNDVEIVEQQVPMAATNNAKPRQFEHPGTLPSIVIDPIRSVVEDFVNQEKRNY